MESVWINTMTGRAKRLLSSLEKRVLRIAAEHYKNRYADIDPMGSALVSTKLCAGELEGLFEALRELPPVMKVQLTGVFSEMEELIFDDSDIASFGPGERKDAYVFLLDTSGTTIPD
jgi:hypothetical protein